MVWGLNEEVRIHENLLQIAGITTVITLCKINYPCVKYQIKLKALNTVVTIGL
jgi:hypothetical protein